MSGTLTLLVHLTADSSIQTGANASNDLQVVALGPQFTFFVNGTQVGQSSDSTFTAGEWGIDNNSTNGEVIYTNVLVLAA